MTNPDDIDNDNSQITEYPPHTDIDQYIENTNFRIERMGSDGIWICAYTDDPDEPDHHYNLYVAEDSGIHITHREENPESKAE